MKQKRRPALRYLAVALALVLTVGFLPVLPVSAGGGVSWSETDVAYPVEGGNIYFNSERGAITKCDASVTRADIPEEIDGVPVEGISDNVFSFLPNLTAISIPASVTNINGDPFPGCTGLKKITVAEDNPNYASDGILLYDKNSGKAIAAATAALSGAYAIPEGVTKITSDLFPGTEVTSVAIPASVTSIDVWAFCNGFYYCEKLESITVAEDNPNYASDGILLYDKNSGKAIAAATASLSGAYAIPEGITKIGYIALWDANITSVTIPASCVEIELMAFYGCEGLKEIQVAEANPSYQSDGVCLFSKDGTTLFLTVLGLTGAYAIPDGVQRIGDYALVSCIGVTSLTVPQSVTELGDWAFRGMSALEEIRFLGDAPSIGYGEIFMETTTTVYYPAGNATWTEEARNAFASEDSQLTWVASYEMIEGGDAEFTIGGDAPAVRADCGVEKFVSVSVDGEEVAAENYTVRSGSTIVEFTEAYLNGLSVGAHKVCLTFTDGVAEATLTVNAGETDPTQPTEPSEPTQPTEPGGPAAEPSTEPTTGPAQPDTEEPKTGDSTNVVLLTALMAVSALALAGGAVLGRKRGFIK